MNKADIILNAIGNIDDRFILEAFKYQSRLALFRKKRVLGILAAILCLTIGVSIFIQGNIGMGITVYAYETNKKFVYDKTILMSGKITDSGEMSGHPLQFYILGDNIANIRFSCKNEKISFVDWTEQRGDYGLSKNFTVAYGEDEEEYYYLVIDWTPESIIRKLTDNENIKIADLKQEEKEDLIVMEIMYLNGERETAAIWIRLADSGEFEVSISQYQITEKDEFVFQPDAFFIEPQTECVEGVSMIALSDEELEHIEMAIVDYYISINCKISGFIQVDSAPFIQKYEGYETEEVVIFEVFVEDSENRRYIVIGSKDNWKNCSILNEGY